jgi:hypothetical protein
VLDGFEDTAGLSSNGRLEGMTPENRGGEHAVRLVATAAETTVSRDLNADLSRWQDEGGEVLGQMHDLEVDPHMQTDLPQDVVDPSGSTFVMPEESP